MELEVTNTLGEVPCVVSDFALVEFESNRRLVPTSLLELLHKDAKVVKLVKIKHPVNNEGDINKLILLWEKLALENL